MSRRCLQSLLNHQGYGAKDLSKQIDLLMNEQRPGFALPQDLVISVDAIRQFGNFAAHPIRSLATLEIVDVEDGEAEWCIELCEQLIEHFFERPGRTKERVEAANLKTGLAGKPPLKSMR
jgi:hypothetical protein